MGLFSKLKNQHALSQESSTKGVALITDYAPLSTISEEYRTLRTNIMYSNADKKIKTLSITSAGPSEGKSTVSGNIAVTFANQGLKTLLIDADMRRPTIHATFGLQNRNGLVDLLTQSESEEEAKQAIRETKIENLSVLPSGPIPPNASELLSSKRMVNLLKGLSEVFDMIIFDLPPLTSVTDAQIVASRTDATILVTPYGVAKKGMLLEARGLLEKVNANVIGAVMNEVPASERSGYYRYYGNYR